MRIYLKLNNGRRFKIRAPIGLVKVVLSFGNFGTSIAKKYITEEQKKYIDCIDFKELRKGLDVLKEYKGLKLIEVRAGGGTEIIIII